MEKKLYYQLSDRGDISKVVMELSGAMTWIETDMEDYNPETPEDDLPEFTITPIWLTDDEYDNLPEASI